MVGETILEKLEWMFSLIYDGSGTKNMQEKKSILNFTCHKFSFVILGACTGQLSGSRLC